MAAPGIPLQCWKNSFEDLQEGISWNKQNAKSPAVKNKVIGKGRYFLMIKELKGVVSNLVAIFQLECTRYCSSTVINFRTK